MTPDMWKIQLCKLNYDSRETAAAAAVIDSGWLTMGERVLEFESGFAEMLGGGPVHCLAVANGTAALHMAVLACGVVPGDEVIVPGLTFVADANVVRLAGAHPVPADCVSTSDLNISAADIERKITPKTRAVIVVHFAGYPCDMDAIVDVCRRSGLALIEDAAHAPGAHYKGRPLGTIGDVGCFSFFSNKNIATGEGGMVSTRDAALAQRLALLRSHGMTTLTLDRHKGRASSYNVLQPGMNCRMDETHAALGLVQLGKLAAGNARRADLTRHYRRNLAGTAVSVPFHDRPGDKSAYHILPVLLPAGMNRGGVIAAMKGDGIQTSIHYPAFWSFDAYREMTPDATPVIRDVVGRELTLPLYPTMTAEQVDEVTRSLLAALGLASEVPAHAQAIDLPAL